MTVMWCNKTFYALSHLDRYLIPTPSSGQQRGFSSWQMVQYAVKTVRTNKIELPTPSQIFEISYTYERQRATH